MAVSGDSLIADIAVIHDCPDPPGRGRIAIPSHPAPSERLPRVAASPARASAEV